MSVVEAGVSLQSHDCPCHKGQLIPQQDFLWRDLFLGQCLELGSAHQACIYLTQM